LRAKYKENPNAGKDETQRKIIIYIEINNFLRNYAKS